MQLHLNISLSSIYKAAQYKQELHFGKHENVRVSFDTGELHRVSFYETCHKNNMAQLNFPQ